MRVNLKKEKKKRVDFIPSRSQSTEEQKGGTLLLSLSLLVNEGELRPDWKGRTEQTGKCKQSDKLEGEGEGEVNLSRCELLSAKGREEINRGVEFGRCVFL